MAQKVLQLIYLGIIVLAVVFGTSCAYAEEPIMITLSSHMQYAVFDGKWSFTEEWKQSSLNSFTYDDGTQIALRSAHEGNFVYIMIDDITGTNYQKGSDFALVCFDTNKARPGIPNSNDYCFDSTLGRAQGIVLQGGSPLGLDGNFRRIAMPDGSIAIGGVSDSNDRYSNVPHSSYEFRIPLGTIGRLDHYGFYMTVFDSANGKFYSYPNGTNPTGILDIPPPTSWGDLVSPDESLPEFPWPALVLVMVVSFVVAMKLGNSKVFLRF